MIALISGSTFSPATMTADARTDDDPTDNEPTDDADRTDRRTMRDVSHTAPDEVGANAVWDRGPAEARADAADAPSPADD